MDVGGPSAGAGGEKGPGKRRPRGGEKWRQKKQRREREASQVAADEGASASAAPGGVALPPPPPFLHPSRAAVQPGRGPGEPELARGASRAPGRGARGALAAGLSRQEEQRAEGLPNFRSRPSVPLGGGAVPTGGQQTEGASPAESWGQQCQLAMEHLHRTLSQGLGDLAEREAALVRREKALEAMQAGALQQEKRAAEAAQKAETQLREASRRMRDAEAMLAEAQAMHARAEQMGLDISVSMAELRRREQQLKDQEEEFGNRKAAAAVRREASAAAEQRGPGARARAAAETAGAPGRGPVGAPLADTHPQTGPLSVDKSESLVGSPLPPLVCHEEAQPAQAASGSAPAPAKGACPSLRPAGDGGSGVGSAEGAQRGGTEDTPSECGAQPPADDASLPAPGPGETQAGKGVPACGGDPWRRSLGEEEVAAGAGADATGAEADAQAPGPSADASGAPAGCEVSGLEGLGGSWGPVKQDPDEEGSSALEHWLEQGFADAVPPLPGCQGPASWARGEAPGEREVEEEEAEETELLRPSSHDPPAPEEPSAPEEAPAPQEPSPQPSPQPARKFPRPASTGPRASGGPRASTASGKGRAGAEPRQTRASRVRQMLMRDAPQLLEELEECGMLRATEQLDACLVDLDNDGEALDPHPQPQPQEAHSGHAQGGAARWSEGGLGAHHFSRLTEVLRKLMRPREGGAASSGSTDSPAGPLGSAVPKGSCGSLFWIHNLVALVQQSAVVQKQGWPVSWGWCASLRSFLFVYHRHNRMILECPEYGKATYFFEIEAGVPVRLQVRRLLAVMGAAAVGRADVLNNRPLLVGKDLTPADAECLEVFGWRPGMGLGALLNFVERMYHDRKVTPAATNTAAAAATATPTATAQKKGAGAPEASRQAPAAAPGAATEPGASRPTAPEGAPAEGAAGSGSEADAGLLHSVQEWRERIGARLRKGAEVGRCTRVAATSGLEQTTQVEMGKDA